VPVLFFITVVAIIEIWGSVVLGKMVHKARNMNFTLGVGFSDAEIVRSRVPFAVRAYDPVILGEMVRVTGAMNQSSLRVRLLASPGKSEQFLADDSLSGAITNVIVDTYVGRISDTVKDTATGDVVLDVVDMRIEEGSGTSPPTQFLASFQNASSFVGTTNGAVSTTLFGF
jgi:hypothetical protein